MMSKEAIEAWIEELIVKQFPKDEYSEGFKEGTIHALQRVLLY